MSKTVSSYKNLVDSLDRFIPKGKMRAAIIWGLIALAALYIFSCSQKELNAWREEVQDIKKAANDTALEIVKEEKDALIDKVKKKKKKTIKKIRELK